MSWSLVESPSQPLTLDSYSQRKTFPPVVPFETGFQGASLQSLEQYTHQKAKALKD